MNHWKSALSLALVPAFALTLLSGCQQTAAPPAESSSTGKGGHVIAANTWGVGAYPLDIIFEALTPLETSAGDLSIDLANNEFKVDKVVTDLQNQLTSGADGVLFLGMSQTIFPTVAQLCQNFEVPFVFHANIPADADWPAIQENAYYTGAVISQEYAAGAAMGELGLADGNQTAIISAAALGDYVHDQRIAGFTDTFEAGGGEVVYVAHSADPSEGVQKANDFMTAYPDADMIYCTGGDYLSATISAMSSRPEADYKLYGSDMSPETAQSILNGDVTALNGGQWIAGSLAAALLINRLDGHAILDENDNMNLVMLTKDNAQGFINLMAEGGLLTEADFDTLLYRNNPNVDYQSFYDFVGNVDELISERIS